MPFVKRGMKVYHYNNKRFGVICGANSSGNLNIRFDGDNYSQNCHPHWEMAYYDKKGNIIESFRNSDYKSDLASKLSHIVKDKLGCDYRMRRDLYEEFSKVLNATHFS
jgi:hypothetical protein